MNQIGIFKIDNICTDCKHPKAWHSKGCTICNCNQCKDSPLRTIDNLTYVEYVESQTLSKRFFAVVAHVPISLYCWYRDGDDLDDFILLKCVLFPLLTIAICGAIVALAGAVRYQHRSHEKLLLSTVSCYTGEKLLYIGRVKSLDRNSNGMEIEDLQGNTYFCNGLKQELSK